MDGYLSVLFLLSSLVIGITGDNKRFIDFRPGYEYVYSFNGYTNVRELGKFLVEAKVNTEYLGFFYVKLLKYSSLFLPHLLWILQLLFILKKKKGIVKTMVNMDLYQIEIYSYITTAWNDIWYRNSFCLTTFIPLFFWLPR